MGGHHPGGGGEREDEKRGSHSHLTRGSKPSRARNCCDAGQRNTALPFKPTEVCRYECVFLALSHAALWRIGCQIHTGDARTVFG